MHEQAESPTEDTSAEGTTYEDRVQAFRYEVARFSPWDARFLAHTLEFFALEYTRGVRRLEPEGIASLLQGQSHEEAI